MKRLFFAIPIVLFMITVAAFWRSLGRDPSILPSMLINKPLPKFALAPVRARDRGLKTADLRGRARLLNVFGSWCVSCRLEHPVLMQLKAQGVVIDGVDWKDRPQDGAAWLAEFGDPYARVGNDESGRTAIDLGVTGAPETFVIDAAGRVRYKQVGPIDADVWEKTLKPLLDKLKAGT